jgi:hypothetical protein
MPREITSHKVNGVNDGLTITVMDEPGPGGANHKYRLSYDTKDSPGGMLQELQFQNGPLAEVGTNGITHEALLAVVIDRLRAFQI